MPHDAHLSPVNSYDPGRDPAIGLLADVGPKPRQTPFTLCLLESRGVVLESGGPVRPVS